MSPARRPSSPGTRRSARLGIALALAVLTGVGCRSLPPAVFAPLPADAPAARRAFDALETAAAARRSLRAEARVSVAGQTGESFTRQLLLLERPAKLRLEVVGLLDQRLLVLASDGEDYDLYRAETSQIEGGPVYDALLLETTGLPVTPDEVVALLLAAPVPGEGPAQVAQAEDGRVRLAWSDRTIELDAEGRPRNVVLSGERARVQYEDWRLGDDGKGFPYRIRIDAAPAGVSAKIEFRRVELGHAAPPHLFRLSGTASGEGSRGSGRAVMLPPGGGSR